jgi:hypothetical protein
MDETKILFQIKPNLARRCLVMSRLYWKKDRYQKAERCLEDFLKVQEKGEPDESQSLVYALFRKPKQMQAPPELIPRANWPLVLLASLSFLICFYLVETKEEDGRVLVTNFQRLL